MTNVQIQPTRADFQLEGVVAPFRQQTFTLFNVFLGVAARQGPQHRQALSERPAQQRAHRQPQRFALGIEEGGFEGGFGEGVALHAGVHLLRQVGNALERLAAQQRSQIGFNRGFDRFRAFCPVAQAADRCRFSPAGDPIGAMHADDGQRLATHGRHRQPVRANGGDIHQPAGQGFNGDGHVQLLRLKKSRRDG